MVRGPDLEERPMSFSASVARLQRERPSWTYSEICAELGRRSAAARRRKTKRETVQAKPPAYWWQKD